MKLYLAAVFVSGMSINSILHSRLNTREQEARCGVKHILESYHYIYTEANIKRIRDDKAQVFLDSGAFSAFTLGVDVDIKAYCQYIKKNEDIIVKDDGDLCASVLDGIGDPQKTWENQVIMEKMGARPLPCFHYGEDERYLEYYVKNYRYITLGGMVPISTPQLIHWLDRIWEKYLVDGSGKPRLKVHGFGLTSQRLMDRYPWYSVDSSSWVQISSFGSILVPGIGTLSVSLDSPSAKQDGRHLNTLPPGQREGEVKMIRDQGFDIDRLQSEYLARRAYNMWSFTQLNQLTSAKQGGVYTNLQPELF